MASLFTHGFVGYGLHELLPQRMKSRKLMILSIVAPILPDGDVIGFFFGIPYDHLLGHRGFFHSIFFAIILGIILSALFFRERWKDKPLFIGTMVFLSVLIASHGVLDAMTSGGLGVAFWSPFDNSRLFLPFRSIAVSPIGVSRFFSEWGLRVIISEFFVVWIPLSLTIILGKLLYWVARQRKRGVPQ